MLLPIYLLKQVIFHILNRLKIIIVVEFICHLTNNNPLGRVDYLSNKLTHTI